MQKPASVYVLSRGRNGDCMFYSVGLIRVKLWNGFYLNVIEVP